VNYFSDYSYNGNVYISASIDASVKQGSTFWSVVYIITVADLQPSNHDSLVDKYADGVVLHGLHFRDAKRK